RPAGLAQADVRRPRGPGSTRPGGRLPSPHPGGGHAGRGVCPPLGGYRLHSHPDLPHRASSRRRRSGEGHVIRAWHADERGVRGVEPAEAVKLALAGLGAVWIDFDGVESGIMEALLAPLQVHPLAIEDMVVEINRPKVDNYGPYLYLVVHSARWEANDRPRLRELDLLVGERFVVTYHE